MEGGKDLINNIKPPLLEDAGLEDCALPPDSIHLAFLKAAAAVGSRATVGDGFNENEKSGPSNAGVRITDGVDLPLDGCEAKKGGNISGNYGSK